MMASGNSLAMSLASKGLTTVVRVGPYQVSIPILMTAVSSIFTVAYYASLSRQEAKMQAAQGTMAEPLVHERQLMKVAFAGRNLYISLLGLVLWLMTWRLKV